ncbi:MAG TPA: dockerin type I domain-containing protein [Tepidisphaeraceae bacterium]|nr:dockerin type I domain-containing protein [Tepidisphaeraceae bacterium]
MSSSALAANGPYSTALSNTNPGAIDPGVPGFVGPAGVGVADPSNSVNPAFVNWATGVASYTPAPGVATDWSDSSKTLGPVTGDNFDIASLGDLSAAQLATGVQPGQITLSFNHGIRNGPGADFAVFENSFGSQTSAFIELAYVEVSSDGQHFERFPSISLTPSPLPNAFSNLNPTNLHNLAGKHVNNGDSWGTPFDLSELPSDPNVNPRDIRYVRMVDIPGNGAFSDSQGHPIYDPWQTVGSGGFDLEAVGVLNSWLAGDADFNGKVNAHDLGILARNWQLSGRDFSQGDFNFDGTVDLLDVYLLAQNWLVDEGSLDAALAAAGLPIQSVPEPTSLLSIIFIACSARSRRHR